MKDMQRDTTLNNELDFPELDLHGHPIHPAWLLFKDFVNVPTTSATGHE